MKPSNLPEGIAESNNSVGVSPPLHMNEKCPTGSVPIMRISSKLPMNEEFWSNIKPEDIVNTHLLNNTTGGLTSVSNFTICLFIVF